MLFGGSSSHQAPVEQPPAPVQQQSAEQKPVCETQAKDFVTCLNATGDVNSCSALLEMLKVSLVTLITVSNCHSHVKLLLHHTR